MTYSGELPRHLCTNTVRSGSEQAFEAFVRDEIVPVLTATRPELGERWATLRPAGPNEDGSWSYAFVFYGDHTLDEWDLRGLFAEALGQEVAEAKIADFLSLVERQDVWTFSGTV